MLKGLLRDSVEVRREGKTVSLTHPYWQLELPRDWVETTPGAADFLARRVAAADIPAGDAELAGLLHLLEAQGCLTFHDDVDSYTLAEVKALFIAIRNEWYGHYYRHPVWSLLREGRLSENGLVAWLVHNYHVSRSAGVSDARCATRLPNRALRQLFFHNALEEYSHCDDFYFVRHGRLTIGDDAVKTYVHLPSSLAFDQQMLRMAECDWLGHVLVSYWQESSVRFYEECKTFFQVVEKTYGIEGFFQPWRTHIELDLGYGHADRFGAVFDSDERVTVKKLKLSLLSAWFTFRFLVIALDEIVEEDGRGGGSLRLRSPIQDGVLDPAGNALLTPYASLTAPVQLPVRGTALELQEALQLHAPMNGNGVRAGRCRPPADEVFLRRDIAASIYRALSHAETHDEIRALGRIAEIAYGSLPAAERMEMDTDDLPVTPEAMALANFLRELAVKPTAFCFVLRGAALSVTAAANGAAAGWFPFGAAGLGPLNAFLADQGVTSHRGDGLVTRHLQFGEFLRNWERTDASAISPDFFRG